MMAKNETEIGYKSNIKYSISISAHSSNLCLQLVRNFEIRLRIRTFDVAFPLLTDVGLFLSFFPSSFFSGVPFLFDTNYHIIYLKSRHKRTDKISKLRHKREGGRNLTVSNTKE